MLRLDGRFVRGEAVVDLGPPLRRARLHSRRAVRALGLQPIGVAGQRIGKIAQALAAVAPQHDIRTRVTAELLGDEVEMDQSDAEGMREAAGGHLAELAARHQQAVGARDQLIRGAVVAAEHPRREWMGERERDRAVAGHSVRGAERLRLGERAQCLRGAAQVAVADVEHERGCQR